MTARAMIDVHDFIHQLLNQLTQVITPDEWLEVVSQYARARGANAGTLLWIETDADDTPLVQEVAAAWARQGAALRPVGTRTEISDFWKKTGGWFSNPREATFVEDVRISPFFDEADRQHFLDDDVFAIVFLPMHVRGRWICGVGWRWREAQHFDAQDRAIFNKIMQHAGPVINQVRLLEENRLRAERAEMMRRATEEAISEADFIYNLAAKVNAATTYQQVADAALALQQDCDGVFIDLWEQRDYERARFIEVVGYSINNTPRAFNTIITHFEKDLFPVSNILRNERIWLVEDTQTDPRIDDRTRASWRQLGTRGLLGVQFMQGSQWMGGIFFDYGSPRQFTERDVRLASGIGDLVYAAIERIRLQMETDQDRAEAALLSRMAEGLNAAMTYQELVEAVAQLYPQSSGIGLVFFEHMDARRATWFQNIAITGFTPDVLAIALSIQFPIAAFPVDPHTYIDRIWYSCDIANDPMLSPESRAFYLDGGSKAAVGVAIAIGERVVGAAGFRFDEPTALSERELNLFRVTGDLMSKAVERIQLQIETDAARARSEQDREEATLLYDLATAINATNTFQEVTDAVLKVYSESEGVYLQIWEDLNYATAEHYRMAGSAVRGGILQVDGDTDELIARSGLGTYYDQVLSSPRPWCVEDTETDSRVEAHVREIYRRLGVRATVVVTFLQSGRWLGSISLRYSQPRRFDDRARRIALGIGDLVQATIERIHTRLRSESERDRAQIMASVSAALSQAEDESAMIEAVAPLAQATGAALTMITYADENATDVVRVIANRVWEIGLPESSVPAAGFVFETQQFSLLRLVQQQTEGVLYVDDIRSHAAAASEEQAFMLKAGWAASATLPCSSGSRFIGTVSFIWTKPHVFREDERALFDALRPIASSVIKTRRAYLAAEAARRETELRARELQTVAQVSAAAVTMLDERQLLDAVAWLIQENFQPHHVLLYTLDSGLLMPQAGLRDSNLHPIALFAENAVARAARSRTAVIGRERWQESVGIDQPAGGYSIELAAPLVVGDTLIGVLCLRALPGFSLTESDLRVTSTLADLIAVAVQNVRSFQGAQELAALEERTRLARELHDSVSQALYGIGLGAKTAKALLDRDPTQLRGPVEYILSLAEAGLAEMRALIFELRPESLENEGLITALSKQSASVQARHNIDVVLELTEEPQMPLDQKESLYRVAREAIHNIVKHAAATQITLRLCRVADMLMLEVRDNGRGFDTGRDFPGHLGLHSMRERVIALGGTFDLVSAPGAGTQVRVWLPL
jgi:signal transduction histidine kinase